MRRRSRVHAKVDGALLRLQSGPEHLVRVRGGAGADLAEHRRHRDAEPLGSTVLALLAHLEAGEAELEILVERELHRHVREPEQRGGQARVEGREPLRRVHLARRVPGRAVVPWRAAIAVTVAGAHRARLRHQPRLDDPDRIRHDRRTRSRRDGRQEMRQ